MNLRLFFQVLSRFRVLVLAGLALAFVFAVLSHARVTFDGHTPRFEYRSQERWQSIGTMLVTQRGFPWGRSFIDEVVAVGPADEGVYVPRYSNDARFTGLALIYAKLAKADEVRAIMLRDGPLQGDYGASAVTGDAGGSLPLVAIIGLSTSPEQARIIARRASNAFLTYLERLQDRNEIPRASRVQVQTVEQPGRPQLIEGRRLTKPIFLFVLVATATFMLAFAFENLRPRVQRSDGPILVHPPPLTEAERKSA